MVTLRRPRSILFWLRWLVIVSILPAWVATAFAIWRSYDRERVALQNGTVETARALMQTVDSKLAAATAVMQVLATSPVTQVQKPPMPPPSG